MENIPMYTPTRDYQKHQDEYDTAWKMVLKEGSFIMGKQVEELETKLANYVGSKHCIAMGSGTDALLAALLALNIGPGDTVVTVPFTWIATAEVISLLGAVPVFIDIKADTYNLDPELLQQYLQSCPPNTIKAIIPVDLYGQMADYTRINEIAAKWNIPVIEDAAQSFGAYRDGQMACTATSIGCTSFYPTKPIGCYGDGGACFTDDDELAQSLRAIRSHGALHKFQHTRIGFNGRLDTVQAAILLVKLKYLDESLDKRITNAEVYNRSFADLNWLTPPKIVPHSKHVMAQYTLRIHNNQRNTLHKHLKDLGIGCGVFYPISLHQQPVFKGCVKGSFPVTEKACQETLSIPVFPELTNEEQRKVIAVMQNFI